MKLLVSVVGADEVPEALRGGADIVDVKNPAEGSLGAAPPWVISEVIAAVASRAETSCAIGDLPNLPGTATLAAAGAAALGPDYLKLGLLGVRSPKQAQKLVADVVRATRSVCSSVRVIACAYADWNLVGSLSPFQLPAVAAAAGAAGVLIDTINKDGRTLLDFLTLPDLTRFVRRARRRGLLCGLAGSLRASHAQAISSCDPDVVGIRTAACAAGNRTAGKVAGDNVRLFKHNLLSPHSPPTTRRP